MQADRQLNRYVIGLTERQEGTHKLIWRQVDMQWIGEGRRKGERSTIH